MWDLRGVLLGGQRSVRLAAAPAPAEVRILWEQSMGVRYPAEATCTVPDPSPGTPPGDTTLVAARDCYRRAVQAAVQQAAIDTAVRVLEAQKRDGHSSPTPGHRGPVDPPLAAGPGRAAIQTRRQHNDAVRLRWAAANRIGAERGSGSWKALTAPMLHKVFVAVDDSPAALAAARIAVDIAARTGAHLRFVHITSDGEIVRALASMGRDSELATRRNIAAESLLQHVAAEAERAGVRAEMTRLEGDPAALLLTEASNWGADLVVIGRSDVRGTGRPYVGTVTGRFSS